MWKIVAVDNFARETVADHLVAEHFRSLEEVERCCAILQSLVLTNDPEWFRVKTQDYVLWRGMAEFVDAEPEPFIDPGMT